MCSLDVWAKGSGDRVSHIDPVRELYEITYPQPISRYPTRPANTWAGVCENPRPADCRSLVDWIQRKRYVAVDHPDSRAFDAAIMAMTVAGEQPFSDSEYSFAD